MLPLFCRFPKPIFQPIKTLLVTTMNVFTLKLNGITGKCDWEEQHEDYDYHQEIARSSFADMLHDTERNQKYEAALKVAIDRMHSLGKKALVLDIGTGTGLLSMMAVRNGADRVTACEAFKPMSVCAVDIIKLNGMEGRLILFRTVSRSHVPMNNTGCCYIKHNFLLNECLHTYRQDLIVDSDSFIYPPELIIILVFSFFFVCYFMTAAFKATY